MASYAYIQNLITRLAYNPKDARLNFQVGLEYEKIGQTASALSFYLRSAELSATTYVELCYSAILKVGNILEQQSQRDLTATNVYFQAIEFMPTRPEAYYFLSRYYEKHGSWSEAAMFAQLSINCSKNKKPLEYNPGYPGDFAPRFIKARASFYSGRKAKTEKEYLTIAEFSRNLPPEYFKILAQGLNSLDVSLDKIGIVLPVRDNGSYRAERLKECLKSWEEQTENLSVIHVIIDEDEIETFKFLLDNTNINVHVVQAGITLMEKINLVAVDMASIYKYLAFVGDDIIFKTKWETRIRNYLKSLPAAMAWTNTLDRDDSNLLCTHPIITSNMVKALGFYGCPDVHHNFFDNFWMDITNDAAYNRYFKDIIWDHRRVGWEPDNMYWNIVNLQSDDEIRYNEYKETKYPSDLEKIKALNK